MTMILQNEQHSTHIAIIAVQAHEERCTDVQWHPQALATSDAGVMRSTDALSFATASADGSAKLWNMAGTCLHACSGHARRLARLAFHPNGTHCQNKPHCLCFVHRAIVHIYAFFAELHISSRLNYQRSTACVDIAAVSFVHSCAARITQGTDSPTQPQATP